MLEIYESDNYKEALKNRLSRLKQVRRGLTLKKIAQNIGVQYTYLSKTFNHSETHLSEDHLFKLCQLLELDRDELEFILLHRSFESSGDEARKEYLFKRIQEKRQEKKLASEILTHNPGQLEREMDYLFDPYCVLIHVSLYIDKYRENPLLLTDPLKISINRLKDILRILEVNNFIVLGEGPFEVKVVLNKHLHYGRNHPLMRIHQSLFKTAINEKLHTTIEENKLSQMFSFTMDDTSFKKVSVEYQGFIKKVQKIAIQGRNTGLYQISFDLFKWY